jgi:formyltetrahydrofolate-dependent phosphoribosylglycinamide formyltransferase
MLKIAAFVSGRGSNLTTVYEKVSKNKIEISFVVSDRINCQAVIWAAEKNIPVFFVCENVKEGFVDFNFLLEEFKRNQIGLIILAGFLKKIPDFFVDQFENRIINIHPALLPSFGGKGMYGMNVHHSVFNEKQKFSGATVHFVDKIYDNGKIISQKKIDISSAKDAHEIAERVLKIEHEILPWVVDKFADGKVKVVDNVVLIEG